MGQAAPRGTLSRRGLLRLLRVVHGGGRGDHNGEGSAARSSGRGGRGLRAGCESRILEQQIQGGIVYGLANALRAKITIEKGRVVQGNFDDYAPLRMEETPAVEVYAVPSAESPTGIGEPSVPPVAPALCNAIYAATKKRIRALPILS